MDLVKKNILSIVLGVIALASVVVIFFPLGGMYAAIATEVAKSKAVGESIATVSKEQRFWPSLSSDPASQQPLKRFPTEVVNDVGTKITASWTKQKDEFIDAAVKVQADALKELVPGVLPGVQGQMTLAYRFMEAYGRLMNVTRPGVAPVDPALSADNGPPKPVLNTPLTGRLPPTETEIKARGDEREAQLRRDLPRVIDNQISNQAEVDQAVVEQRNAIGDQLRADVAKKSIVYLDPVTSFIASDKIVGNTAPSYNEIFIAQAGLWVQQEICRAIYEVNRPSIERSKQGVIDAPIKRLIGIRFALPYVSPPAVAPGTPAPTDVPVVPGTPPGVPAARVATDFTRNPLGQSSNELYDVVPFRIVLVCEAETLPQTLAGLGRNRYLSVRSMDVQAVDAALAYTQGFIYGNRPVVQTTIRGQYLILRKFIGPLMPPDIIRALTAPAAAPGTPGAPGDPSFVG